MALQEVESTSAGGNLSQVWSAQEKLHELRAQQMAVLHGEVAVLRSALDDHKALFSGKLADLEETISAKIQRSAEAAREDMSSNARIIQEVQKAMSDLSELAFQASDLQGGIAKSQLALELQTTSERLSNFPSPASLHRAVEQHESLANWVRESATLQERARGLAERRQDGFEQAIVDLRAQLKAGQNADACAKDELESTAWARLAELESRVTALGEDLAQERKDRLQSCKAISRSLKETFEETSSLTLLDTQSQHHIEIGRLEQEVQRCRTSQEEMHRHVMQVRQVLQSSVDGVAAEVKGLTGRVEDFSASGKDVDSIKSKLQESLREVPSALEDLGSRLDDIASKTQALQLRFDAEIAERIAADKDTSAAVVSLGEQPSSSEIVERLEDQIARLGESLRQEMTIAKQQITDESLALNEESEHRVLDHLALATQQLRKDVETVQVMMEDARKTIQAREAAEEAVLSRGSLASQDQGGLVEALRQQLGQLRIEVTALSAVVDGCEADRELSGKMLEEHHTTLRSLQEECTRANTAAADAGEAADRFGEDQRALTEFSDQKFLSMSQQLARLEKNEGNMDVHQKLTLEIEKLDTSIRDLAAQSSDSSHKMIELGSFQETLRTAHDDIVQQVHVLRQAVPSSLNFIEVQQSVHDIWETLKADQQSVGDAISKLRQQGRNLEISHAQFSEETDQLKQAVSNMDSHSKGNHDKVQHALSDILQGIHAAKQAWREELEQVQESTRANLTAEMTGLISSHDALVERVTTLAGELKNVDTVHQKLSNTVETRQARLQEQLDAHRRHCETEQATLRRELVSACEDLLDLRSQTMKSEQGLQEMQTSQEIFSTRVEELRISIREHAAQASGDRDIIKELAVSGAASRDEVQHLCRSIVDFEARCEDLAKGVSDLREWTEQQLGKAVESMEHRLAEENRSRVLAVADATSHNRRTRKWVEDWFNEATDDREKLTRAVEVVSERQERVDARLREQMTDERGRVDQLLEGITEGQQAVTGQVQDCFRTVNTTNSDLTSLRRELDQQVKALQTAVDRVQERVAAPEPHEPQRIAEEVARILQSSRQRQQPDVDLAGYVSEFGKAHQSIPHTSLRSPPVLRYRSTERSEEGTVSRAVGSPAMDSRESPQSCKRLVTVPTDLLPFQSSSAPVAKGPLKAPESKVARLSPPSAIVLPAPACELVADTPASRLTRISSYGDIRQSPAGWPATSRPL
mmetsp:Transcript_21056/g.47290  ORF Transcript_21056/g.47290 Transcript_21056/m.47290 type:complete len:1219 (+) Transcript_21056:62-3718(+)